MPPGQIAAVLAEPREQSGLHGREPTICGRPVHEWLPELLCCSRCRGHLTWSVADRCDGMIETADARCRSCGATFPVREGIGVFVVEELERDDLWEHAAGGLTRYLAENPDVERALLERPDGELAPADRWFRVLVLEERGRWDEALALRDSALAGIYHAEYLAAVRRQLDHVTSLAARGDGPVVDLASGRGALVETLAASVARPVVVTDFSLRVLRRDREAFRRLGVLADMSLLAVDLRRTPFADGALSFATTNLGLQNVTSPLDVLDELRRVVGGELLAISHFLRPDDAENVRAAREAGVEALLLRESALMLFRDAGFTAELENVIEASAAPTPVGELLPGATVDGLPVAPTTLEWATVRAR